MLLTRTEPNRGVPGASLTDGEAGGVRAANLSDLSDRGESSLVAYGKSTSDNISDSLSSSLFMSAAKLSSRSGLAEREEAVENEVDRLPKPAGRAAGATESAAMLCSKFASPRSAFLIGDALTGLDTTLRGDV